MASTFGLGAAARNLARQMQARCSCECPCFHFTLLAWAA